MKQNAVVNARKINKMRFIAGIAICALVIGVTFVTLVLSAADYHSEVPESGLGTLRMFTTLSNILAAVAAFMCLPFQIDGLRRDRYRLPSWIVFVMYIGAVGTFLTFTIALTLISAYQGFVHTMFYNSNLFYHTINPILITFLFTIIISDSHIKFKTSFFALIPVAIYAIVYYIMVFVIKSWRDHYQTNSIIPWPVSLLLIVVVAFGVCQLLRFLHNLTNKYVTKNIVRYYKESPDFEFPKVYDAVKNLAKFESNFYYKGDDIYIPVDIIQLLAERYNVDKFPVDILYDIYLENYLIAINERQNPRQD